MRQKAPKIPKKDDPITAEWARELAEYVIRNGIDIGQCIGFDQRQTPYGTALTVRQPGRDLAITTSTITAGSSGFVGSGTAARYIITPSTGAITGITESLKVFNFSTTTGGIASGTRVWIEQNMASVWVITSVDCGN